MMKPFIFFAAVCGAVLLTACAEDRGPVLTVEGGQLAGVESATEGVTIYKGIPYAAPPVGEFRWREPQPVISWDGVKNADTFAAAAMQSDQKPGSFYGKEFFWKGDPARSEDCLYLNVWTPAAGMSDAKLPVAVWIHGGSYMQGYGHEVEFDGEEFARRGVILVTFNYRLGVFGFMAHPLLTAESPDHSSGNYGILDQCAALRWVHKNIAQFGGDPDNLTLMGQDAGAGSVQMLLTSPQCGGAVSKAVIQSAAGLRNPNGYEYTLASAEENGVRLLEFAGLASLKGMRALPAEMVDSLAANYSSQMRRPIRFAPNIDGRVAPQSFSSAARESRLPDIPYLMGYTGGDSESLKRSVDSLALLLEGQGRRPIYVYNFTRSLPGDRAGAFRSAELWYEFGTLSRSWRPFTDSDRALSDRMMGYWTNFIKTGDPNGEGLAPWHPLTNADPGVCQLEIEQNLKK